MTGEVEAAGAATQAALTAAVLDGAERRRSDPHVDSGACANCGRPLTGAFCSGCGQSAHVHRSLSHMVEEFFHGLVHFDARVWRTLPRLFLQPGRLAHDYIHGKRAAYISPLALFLLTIFLMFFVFSLTGGATLGVQTVTEQTAQVEGEVARLTAEVAGARAALDGLESDDPRLGRARERLQAQLAALTDAQAGLDRLRQVEASAAAANEGAEPGASATIFDQIREAAERGDITVDTGDKKLDAKLRHKLLNPEFAFYKLQNTAYKLSFLLVPISLPFMWLLFAWKRGITLFDHTVVVLYSLSFVSLWFIAVSLLYLLPGGMPDVLGSIVGLLPAVHLFLLLKGAYRLTTVSALWRTGAVLFSALLSLLLFSAAIIWLGLAS